jgi:hypothetical protein
VTRVWVWVWVIWVGRRLELEFVGRGNHVCEFAEKRYKSRVLPGQYQMLAWTIIIIIIIPRYLSPPPSPPTSVRPFHPMSHLPEQGQERSPEHPPMLQVRHKPTRQFGMNYVTENDVERSTRLIEGGTNAIQFNTLIQLKALRLSLRYQISKARSNTKQISHKIIQ